MTESVLNRSALIVFRLRAALLVIVLLLVGALVISSIQLRYLSNSQTRSVQISLPALANSQRLESLLAQLLLLQGEVRAADTADATDALIGKVKLLKADIKKTNITPVNESNSSSLSLIPAQLLQLDQSYSSLLPIRVNLNDSNESLLKMRERLSSLRNQFRNLIEPRLIDTETALNNALLSTDSNKVDLQQAGATISTLVDTQNKLIEISFRFLTVVDAVELLSEQNANTPTDQVRININLNIRVATQLLASLEEDEFRRELAVLSNNLRKLILSETGIFVRLSRKTDIQAQFEVAQNKQSVLITGLSSSIDEVVSTAKSDISRSAKQFENALLQTIVTLTLIGSLIIVIIVLLSYVVVERQINKRLSLLTDAVLAIANGDTEHDVKVHGKDEIGVMANSLKIFKTTAKSLLTSNEELEQFAYAASHDLRSPLRAIQNLAQWTIEDAGDTLPEECTQNLTKILERAQRLSTLQSDLLEYSRAGHSDNSVETINMNTLITDISEILDPDEKFPVVITGYKDSLDTYITPLRQVLINLINNAIKHHDKKSGNIHVFVLRNGARMSITVQDDGPGIEPEYQGQIFELFNMLTSHDEVEGSGLGLALVRKLVGRYEGSISVQSDPKNNTGTLFKFDWPVFSFINP